MAVLKKVETCPLKASNTEIRLRLNNIVLLIEELRVQDIVMMVRARKLCESNT